MSKIFSKEVAKESILYNYKHGFSGFADVLTPCQAKFIACVTMLVNCKLCFLSFESEFSFLISKFIFSFAENFMKIPLVLFMSFQTEFLICIRLEVGIFWK